MEAQAADQWPLGKQVQINQHIVSRFRGNSQKFINFIPNLVKTLQDRINAAKLFQKEANFQIPLFVDAMDNNFNKAYAAWPERAYVIHNRKMAYICDAKTDGSIDWEIGIETWLQNQFPKE